MLAHTDWGASTKTLLRLYRALVRSKLDYGCVVYRNASDTDLKALDVIHNQGLRLCLGAFKSSPVESLYVEANELPLRERRQELLDEIEEMEEDLCHPHVETILLAPYNAARPETFGLIIHPVSCSSSPASAFRPNDW